MQMLVEGQHMRPGCDRGALTFCQAFLTFAIPVTRDKLNLSIIRIQSTLLEAARLWLHILSKQIASSGLTNLFLAYIRCFEVSVLSA